MAELALTIRFRAELKPGRDPKKLLRVCMGCGRGGGHVSSAEDHPPRSGDLRPP